MPNFKFVALEPSGKKLRGVIGAASAVRVRNDLLARELKIIEVKERKGFTKFEITKKKIKPADLMNFSRQLAAFLRAGVPIIEALQALLEDVPSAVLRQVLVDIIDGLTTGTTLSDAIAAHSGLFPRYYVGILRSAELTGNLDVVLDQLAGYIERDLEARRAVKSALTYPLVIMAMSAITVVILVGWVLPKFQAFFAGFKQQLPLPTRLLMGGSRFMTQRGPVILAGAAVLGLLLYLYLRTERGRYSRDRFMLRIPLLGGVVQYAVVERFCRILGSMLHAGVPVPEALAAAGEGANNRVYERALRVARDQVLQGEGLAKPVTATGLFPRAASQMFRVGEASGTLDTQLVMTADFYAGELAHRVKKLTALFEPLVIIVMGGIVGFVAVALVSAMYGIFNSGNIQ